jgi:ParB-like chromosome segregation protein Spo0J
MPSKEQPFVLEPVSRLTPGENGLIPPLTDEEYAALKADIKKSGGVLVPISIDEDNVVLDGHHRLRACEELRIETVPTRLHSMLDPSEKTDLALRLNLKRRNLSQKQKREVIAAVLIQDQGKRSDSLVAAAVGVDHKTVASVRAELVERREIPNVEKREDSKGRKQPASRPKATSGRRQASNGKSTGAKSGRARTRAERQAKTGEVILPITFRNGDADLPARIQRIAETEDVSTEAWCVRVLREAVEAAESNERHD